MHKFGELIGIAFQIKDDLFDYQKSHKIGKPTGIDIKEQKMTLPLIYTLQHCEKKERKHIINIVKRHHKNPKKVQEVIDMVNAGGGIDYSRQKMKEYKEKALDILDSMPENEARESMRDLVEYAIERKK
jgi:octaprenyl-diphosphate synthase